MTTTKEGLFIMKKEEKKVYKPCFSKCKETFSKGFMLVTRFSYSGKLKVRNVKKRKRKKTQMFTSICQGIWLES